MKQTIKIGTRGSQLALWQANWVKSALVSNFPSLSVELVIIKTTGDKILDAPLAQVGGKGLFVKEIEESLLSGRTDLAVHSMKDMPAVIPSGLCIGSVPERETTNDVLISKNNLPLAKLNKGARIGTSSLRRAAQLRYVRPDVEIVPLRGNLDTRIRKLETEALDAIVLAAAGVKRLNFDAKITEYLDESVMLPAAGQGALCIEIRKDDRETARLVEALDHPDTHSAVLGERAFLSRLEGSCQVPIAARAEIENGRLTLRGLVADIMGTAGVKDTISGPAASAETLGIELADRLLSMGARDILENLKADLIQDEKR